MSNASALRQAVMSHCYRLVLRLNFIVAVELLNDQAGSDFIQCQTKMGAFAFRICSEFQGHPMDLFLKISVLQAHFCWLGDVKEIIVLGRKVLLGKR